MPVRIDMVKAREIHMGNIRVQRNKELAALDLPFMRAVEAGDQAAQKRIGVQKQELRDIPQRFDVRGCPTPQALIRRWPDNLGRSDCVILTTP